MIHLMRLALFVPVLALTVAGVAFAAATEPAAISSSERLAVSLVAEYLDGGSAALWARVEPGTWLHGQGPSRGQVELSVRMGPVRGSRWTLARLRPRPGDNTQRVAFRVEFPSGIDDLILLDLDVAGGRLRSVSTLAEANTSADVGFAMEPLANLRHLLARGDVLLGEGTRDVEALLAAEGKNRLETTVRRLWLAQYHLLQVDSEGALEALASPDGTPKAEVPLELLLRARVAALQQNGVDAERHYRNLLGRLDTDVFQAELVDMLLGADDWTRGMAELGRLTESDSRMAEPRYELSRFLLFSHLGRSEAAFRAAWRLQPIERSQLLEDPYYAFLLGSVDLADVVRLDEAEEPVAGPAPSERKAARWPAGVEFRMTGQHLLAVVGGAVLSLPGGAVLAPEHVAPAPPRELRYRLDELALAAVPGLRARLRDAASLQSPALLREVEESATALTRLAERGATVRRQDAWRRLEELTKVVQQAPEQAPGLAALRAQALWQLGRKQLAIDLLAALVADTKLVDEDPSARYQLARLCGEEGRPDLAARLLRRLPDAERFSGLMRQIARYELDDRLGESYATYQTTAFQLRYDRSLAKSEVVLLGGYLEVELERLKEWIPLDVKERIEVHLVPASDFYRVYGGGVGILGLFDGRIRLPVFEVGKQSAVMTGVLSHELAHAMLDVAAHDCAPKWFHEGLAQLVEPGGRQINPYRAGVRPIAMPLVESVLRGFSESRMVTQAYEEAYWTLRFVETKHGRPAIHRLIESFADCRDTPEALQGVLAQSPAEFDRELQAWAKGPDAPLEAPGVRLAFTKEQLDHMEKTAPGFSEVVEERDASRSMPKVGIAAGVELPTEKDMEDAFVKEVTELMVEWHGRYVGRANLIKQKLATMVRAIRQPQMSQKDLQSVCDDLWTLTVSIQMGGVLESIDKDVNRSLRAAYAAIGKAASACARGKSIGPALDNAEKHLGEAAYHLDKYGLKP